MTFIKTMNNCKLLKHFQLIKSFNTFIFINSICVMGGCLSFFLNVMVFLTSVDYPCVLSDYRLQATYQPYCHLDLFGYYDRIPYRLYISPTERIFYLFAVLCLFGLSFVCLSRTLMVWSRDSQTP